MGELSNPRSDMQRRIRVLVGKPGLDGHDRGAKVVAAALRDAGMEVIYTGLHQSSEQIVEAALQEDVDVVALSILSGAHMTQFPEVLALMRQRGLDDRLLTGGGIIPPEDMKTLAQCGVGRLFGPGSSTLEIVEYIRAWYAGIHGADALTPLPPPRESTPRVVPRSSAPRAAALAPAPAAEDRHHAPAKRGTRSRRTPAAASGRPKARTRAAAASPQRRKSASARPTARRAAPAKARSRSAAKPRGRATRTVRGKKTSRKS
jgi:methylmalonyl-CoA mutase C-terminal domain/subunit